MKTTPIHPLKGLAAAGVFLAAGLMTLGAKSHPVEANADEIRLAESILVKKSERRLYLMRGDKPVREYRISLGGNPVGHKQQEGDQRTPEGDYYIDWRNPNSAFHLSLRISYPNDEDRAQAEARGVDPGGMIMIHGQRNRLGWLGGVARHWDWTEGCIAVTNAEMEEIWRWVPDGTPIRIKP